MEINALDLDRMGRGRVKKNPRENHLRVALQSALCRCDQSKTRYHLLRVLRRMPMEKFTRSGKRGFVSEGHPDRSREVKD